MEFIGDYLKHEKDSCGFDYGPISKFKNRKCSAAVYFINCLPGSLLGQCGLILTDLEATLYGTEDKLHPSCFICEDIPK